MKSTAVTWVGALGRGRFLDFIFQNQLTKGENFFIFIKRSKIMLKDAGNNKDKIIASYKWYLD